MTDPVSAINEAHRLEMILSCSLTTAELSASLAAELAGLEAALPDARALEFVQTLEPLLVHPMRASSPSGMMHLQSRQTVTWENLVFRVPTSGLRAGVEVILPENFVQDLAMNSDMRRAMVLVSYVPLRSASSGLPPALGVLVPEVLVALFDNTN